MATTYQWLDTIYRPATDQGADLGDSTHRWKNLYVSGAIVGGALINQLKGLIPNTGNILTYLYNGTNGLLLNGTGNLIFLPNIIYIIGNTAGTETRLPGIFFSTTTLGISSNNTSDTTLLKGIVGTTSLVANTFSEGRTIRLTSRGIYNSSADAATSGTLNFNVKFGGNTILTTSNRTVTVGASTLGWTLNALLTCQTTGGAGTISAMGDVPMQSSATDWVSWQMVGSIPVVVNTTAANIIEITVQWAVADSANQVFMTHAIGELLN